MHAAGANRVMAQSGAKRAGQGAICAAALASLFLQTAAAQTASPPASGVAALSAPPSSEPSSSDLAGRRLELRGLEDNLDALEAQRRKLESDVEAMRTDRARLNAALIDTTEKIRDSEQRADAAQKRLDGLTGNEEAIRVSLGNRRAIVGEVLASLQRMGRRAPPALLVKPEDMLSAIRTSMLLGAVLPELRAETEALATDLAELVKLRTGIGEERDTLSRELAGLRDDRQRLALLVGARQQALSLAQRDLETQRDKTHDLARQATSLKDLITSVEAAMAAAQRTTSDQSAKAEAARKQADTENGGSRTRVAGLPGSPFNDVARLAPAIAFADAKGLLPMPVNGTPIKLFGSPDGFGSSEKGLSLTTRPQATVTAPCDGWVAFSGPYRTYGQLLIINAGSGYYVVLAGMERINVDVGQFVLTGEPVASMGDGTAKTAAAIAIGAAQPILYVEFRKDGTAIDSGPWWARSDMKKVRG
ncbi:MAG: peptidoglycan DD-metalloendopeptidase family protein [Beijerinckiaceae bacterium]